MGSEFQSLNTMQLDVLKEIGNIGAGNAATALATMISGKIEMKIPEIGILGFNEVTELVGGADAYVTGIYLIAKGPAPVNILFLISVEKVCNLLDLLMDRPANTSKPETLDEIDYSAITEIGNIISSTFLNALASVTGFEFTPSVPAMAMDMAGAVMDSVLALFGEVEDHVLLLKTQFIRDKEDMVCNFFLLPNAGSLKIILSALGVNNNG